MMHHHRYIFASSPSDAEFDAPYSLVRTFALAASLASAVLANGPGWYDRDEADSCDQACLGTGQPCNADALNAVTSEAIMTPIAAHLGVTCLSFAEVPLSYAPYAALDTCYYRSNDPIASCASSASGGAFAFVFFSHAPVSPAHSFVVLSHTLLLLRRGHVRLRGSTGGCAVRFVRKV